MKAKGNEDRNWKEVQCKTLMRENFKYETKFGSKRNDGNSTNSFELLSKSDETDGSDSF